MNRESSGLWLCIWEMPTRNMYQLPMDEAIDLSKLAKTDVYENNATNGKQLAGRPLLYDGTFNLDETGDTFIDMSHWGKGIIFINGHHIGRYWNVGPQQTLFIPGVWLKKGANRILIFEQLNNSLETQVSTLKTPVLKELKIKK